MERISDELLNEFSRWIQGDYDWHVEVGKMARELQEARSSIASLEQSLFQARDCANKRAAEVESLEQALELQKGANRAQDERERLAAERLGMVHTCDWPDDVAEALLEARAEIERLRAGGAK